MKIQWSRSLLLGATFTFITHSHLFPLSSLQSESDITDNIARHTKMRFITSELRPPGAPRSVACRWLWRWERKIIMMMPRGGRWVIIRLFVTITIMLSRSKIVVFLLALHDTTICYFRPAPASASSGDLNFSSNTKSGFKNQDPEKTNHITHILCKSSSERI